MYGRDARTAPAFSLGRVGERKGAPVCGHPSIGAAPLSEWRCQGSAPKGSPSGALDNDGSVKILGRRGRAAKGDGPTEPVWYGLCLLLVCRTGSGRGFGGAAGTGTAASPSSLHRPARCRRPGPRRLDDLGGPHAAVLSVGPGSPWRPATEGRVRGFRSWVASDRAGAGGRGRPKR